MTDKPQEPQTELDPEAVIEKAKGMERVALILENLIETLLFHSRWLLAPMYVGLVITLLLLAIKFVEEVVHLVPAILSIHGTQLILAALSLVDLVLIANLLLMIIFSGYENFVSKIDMIGEHVDRPDWMGKIDYTAMKLKLIGSIVAISSIELLKAFINVHNIPREDLAWMVGIHMTFVISGTFYALMEKLYHSIDKH